MFDHRPQNQMTNRPHDGKESNTLVGCRWDNTNWSCAYDAVLVPLFHVLRDTGIAAQASFASTSAQFRLLTRLYMQLSEPISQPALEKVWRDGIRQHLHSTAPKTFPKGRRLVSVDDVVSQITDNARPTCRTNTTCVTCAHTTSHLRLFTLPFVIDSTLLQTWRILSGKPEIPGGIQPFCEWLQASSIYGINSRNSQSSEQCCTVCGSAGPIEITLTAIDAVPLLYFDVAGFAVQPSIEIELPSNRSQGRDRYRLFACVYFGDAHFSARYIDADEQLWEYDGQRHNGALVRQPQGSSADLRMLSGRSLSGLGCVLKQ